MLRWLKRVLRRRQVVPLTPVAGYMWGSPQVLRTNTGTFLRYVEYVNGRKVRTVLLPADAPGIDRGARIPELISRFGVTEA